MAEKESLNTLKLASKNIGECIDLQIVALPKDKARKRLIDLSNSISGNFRSLFKLNDTDCLPHLTFYQTAYPEKNFDRIEEAIINMTSVNKAFSVTLSGFSLFHEAIFYEAINKENISHFHKTIVERLNVWREGMLTEECKAFLNDDNLDSVQKDNIMKYGNPLVMDFYRPHVTLTNLVNPEKSGDALSYLDKIEEINLKFIVNEIVLSSPRPYRTYKKIIERFPLSG